MKVIGLSDQFGAYHRADGIDVRAAEKYAAQHGSLRGFTEADRISPDELLTLQCDVLVPAAAEAVITEHNAGKLRCRILAEGSNGPTTPAADRILFGRWAEV